MKTQNAQDSQESVCRRGSFCMKAQWADRKKESISYFPLIVLFKIICVCRHYCRSALLSPKLRQTVLLLLPVRSAGVLVSKALRITCGGGDVHAFCWLICWSTFTLLCLWLWCPPAKTCCGVANATPASATATTIDAIANVVLLWFISQKQSSSILYLRCFTASANNIGEIPDIFKVWYIHQNNYSQNIVWSIREIVPLAWQIFFID